MSADETPDAVASVAYARTVLDALELRHGPSHMEVRLLTLAMLLVPNRDF